MFHMGGLCGIIPVSSAYLAVDLFFLLSGFVISHAYGQKLSEQWSVVRFMTVRLIRLWPLHLLGIVVAGIVVLASLIAGTAENGGWTYYGAAAATAPLFLPTFPFSADTPLFPLNVPAWSLFIELIANLVAALVWRRLSNLVLGCIVGLSALGLIALSFGQDGLDQGALWGELPGGMIRVGFSFFLGIAFYRLRDHFAKLAVHPLVLAVAVAALFMPNLSGTARSLYDVLAVLVVCPLLVAAGSASQPWRGGTALFLLAGQISYALYVLHAPGADVAALALGILHHRDWWASPIARTAFLFPLLLGCWVAMKIYDEPVRAFLTARFRPRAPA